MADGCPAEPAKKRYFQIRQNLINALATHENMMVERGLLSDLQRAVRSRAERREREES